MGYSTTILHQVLKMIPRQQFEPLAQVHSTGRPSRVLSRWGQFVALSFAQLTGRVSLRDVVLGLAVQERGLAALGMGKVARSTLAAANQRRPASFFAALFGEVYGQCQTLAPKHKFKFKNKVYSLDASFMERWQIELFFKWVKQRLKLKTFLGISPNAVLTQLWVALIVSLLLAYLKFKNWQLSRTAVGCP